MIAFLLAIAAQVTAPVEPSAAALALAKTTRDEAFDPAIVKRAEEGLAVTLFTTIPAWRGAGCDPQLPACRAAAERIAREAAPAVLAARRDLSDQVLAIVIDDAMTPEEIGAATRFAQTPAGRSFGRALLLLGNPSAVTPGLSQKLAQVMMTAPRAIEQRALIDRFYDATASLPRRTLPLAPPPPQPPAPSRKP